MAQQAARLSLVKNMSMLALIYPGQLLKAEQYARWCAYQNTPEPSITSTICKIKATSVGSSCAIIFLVCYDCISNIPRTCDTCAKCFDCMLCIPVIKTGYLINHGVGRHDTLGEFQIKKQRDNYCVYFEP